jgi:hypothetical protein
MSGKRFFSTASRKKCSLPIFFLRKKKTADFFLNKKKRLRIFLCGKNNSGFFIINTLVLSAQLSEFSPKEKTAELFLRISSLYMQLTHYAAHYAAHHAAHYAAHHAAHHAAHYACIAQRCAERRTHVLCILHLHRALFVQSAILILHSGPLHPGEYFLLDIKIVLY